MTAPSSGLIKNMSNKLVWFVYGGHGIRYNYLYKQYFIFLKGGFFVTYLYARMQVGTKFIQHWNLYSSSEHYWVRKYIKFTHFYLDLIYCSLLYQPHGCHISPMAVPKFLWILLYWAVWTDQFHHCNTERLNWPLSRFILASWENEMVLPADDISLRETVFTLLSPICWFWRCSYVCFSYPRSLFHKYHISMLGKCPHFNRIGSKRT